MSAKYESGKNQLGITSYLRSLSLTTKQPDFESGAAKSMFVTSFCKIIILFILFQEEKWNTVRNKDWGKPDSECYGKLLLSLMGHGFNITP